MSDYCHYINNPGLVKQIFEYVDASHEINTVCVKPSFSRCSRLYWSTVDPRRRCKYTCKVTEVSTPLPGEEQDPQWDQEENHTIVHSPNHHRGEQDLTNMRTTLVRAVRPKQVK